MFAYCNNSPISLKDTSGTVPWVAIGVAAAVAAIIGVDHYLAKNHPDGVYTKQNPNPDGSVTETLYARGSGATIDKNGASLLDVSAGASTSYVETPNGREYYLSALHLDAEASVDWSGIPSVEASAIASALSLSKTFTIQIFSLNVDITLGGHVLAAGAGVEFDWDNGKFAYTPPTASLFVPACGVDIDWN